MASLLKEKLSLSLSHSVSMFYDRIGRGDDPSEFWIDRIRCLDVGVDRGGYGETLFRIYCEKALSTRAR
jgi:hypothetical protein